MKRKHIIALAVAVAFIGISALALVQNKVDYSDFAKAQETGQRAQVSGTWDKTKGSNYDVATNTFTFYMKDRFGHELPVKYDGVRPNNFEIAPSVVCVGKVENGVFEASEIQTKCPSRYENSGKMKMPQSQMPETQTQASAGS